MSYKPYLIFLSFIAFGLIVFSVASFGFYPILSVDGSFVSARTFWKNLKAGSIYYNNLVRNVDDISQGTSALSSTDLEISVLTQLVENKLIAKELKKEINKNLDLLIQSKINRFNEDVKFKEVAKTFYGLEPKDFEREILVPLANQEILSGRLFLKGGNIENWLSETKKLSAVKIFSPEFVWENGEVKMKRK